MWDDFAAGQIHESAGPLLCRKYFAVFARRQPLDTTKEARGTTPSVLWAVGLHGDGDVELIGLWTTGASSTRLWDDAVAEMTDRGVERVSFFVCAGGTSAGRAPLEGLGSVCLPSIDAAVRYSIDRVARRDRESVREALRDLVGPGDQRAVADAFASFECSLWGSRYPWMVGEWREVLAQLTPLHGISARRRHVLMSGDRMTEAMQGAVSRALVRRKPTAETGPATDLVERTLRRALPPRIATV